MLTSENITMLQFERNIKMLLFEKWSNGWYLRNYNNVDIWKNYNNVEIRGKMLNSLEGSAVCPSTLHAHFPASRSVQSTKRFSQLLVFLLKPSKCLRILRRCFLRRRLVAWSRSLWGFNFIWANTPTSSSSTWWARPDEVSMNLQPQLFANRRPTVTKNKKQKNKNEKYTKTSVRMRARRWAKKCYLQGFFFFFMEQRLQK